MSTLLQDIRYGLRMLRKTPGFTAVAVLTLAVGIGANTAIYSLVHALLLRNLPVQRPEQLVLFGDGESWGMISGLARQYDIFSYPQYRYFREHSKSFTGICAFASEDSLRARVRLAGAGLGTETSLIKLVSGNYFSVLGVPAAQGRTFGEQDDRPGAPPLAVISDRYWAKKFNRNPSALGQTIDINGALFTIAGVTPPEFFGESVQADPAEIWIPITFQPQATPYPSVLEGTDARWLYLMGRLAPGVTMEQARAELTLQLRQFLTAHMADLGADTPGAVGELQTAIAKTEIVPTPGGIGVAHLRFRYSEPLKILMAMVAVLLAIACANLACMLLARATARQREVSVRLALGASRARLVRQLLTESLLLSLLGGAAGLVVSVWSTGALLKIVFRGAEFVAIPVSPDFRVVAFLAAVSVAAGLLFGVAPALRASRLQVTATLKAGSQPAPAGTRHIFSASRLLVVAQVALSLVLVAAAGLFARTLAKLAGQDLGFDREHVLLVHVDPSLAGYKPEQLAGVYERIRERINALPGVRDSALALYTPLSGENWSGNIAIQDYAPEQNKHAGAAWVRITPGFFDTLGVPLLLGRTLLPQDTSGTRPVAVVNQAFAQKFFSGQNPVGKRFGWSEDKKGLFEIIGVVQDAKHVRPRAKIPAMFYLPVPPVASDSDESGHVDWFLRDLVVRSSGDPVSIAAGVRQALRAVDPNLPVIDISTMDDQVSRSMTGEQLMSGLAGFFGGVALLLACVGLYGLMSYSVARRTAEIGVRMALGAQRGDVLWIVLRETLLLVVAGIVLGVPLILGTARFIAAQLFGVAPHDPLTLTAGVVVLLLVGLAAGYVPARRASRVDPMVALRYE